MENNQQLSRNFFRVHRVAFSIVITVLFLLPAMGYQAQTSGELLEVKPIVMKSSLETFHSYGNIAMLSYPGNTLGEVYFNATIRIENKGMKITDLEISVVFIYMHYEKQVSIDLGKLDAFSTTEIEVFRLPAPHYGNYFGVDWNSAHALIGITGKSLGESISKDFDVKLVPETLELKDQGVINAALEMQEEAIDETSENSNDIGKFGLSAVDGLEITSVTIRDPSDNSILERGINDLLKGTGPRIYFNVRFTSNTYSSYIAFGFNNEELDGVYGTAWSTYARLTQTVEFGPTHFGDTPTNPLGNKYFPAGTLWSFVYNLPWAGYDTNDEAFAWSRSGNWQIRSVKISKYSSLSPYAVSSNIYNGGKFAIGRYSGSLSSEAMVYRLALYDQTVPYYGLNPTTIFSSADYKFDLGVAYPYNLIIKTLIVPGSLHNSQLWSGAQYDRGAYRVHTTLSSLVSKLFVKAGEVVGTSNGWKGTGEGLYAENGGFDIVYGLSWAMNSYTFAAIGMSNYNYAVSLSNSGLGGYFLDKRYADELVQHETSHHFGAFDRNTGFCDPPIYSVMSYCPNSGFKAGISYYDSSNLDRINAGRTYYFVAPEFT